MTLVPVHAEDGPPRPVTVEIPQLSYPLIEDAEAAYQEGRDAVVAGRIEAAIKLFEYSCERRNEKSCFNVGLLLEDKVRESNRHTAKPGALDPLQIARITFAFRESCWGGYQRGCAMLVQYYHLPDYGMQNLPAAIDFARSACNAGEIAGCDDLAEMHYRGEGMPVDFPRAAAMFKDACDRNGRALSCFNYGLMNEKGQGIAPNPKEALDYYRIACRRGADVACINLASQYAQGSYGDMGREIATGLLSSSCSRNVIIACSNLAVMTEVNDPSPAGKTAALTLYRKACDAGYGIACRGIGNLIHDGLKEAGAKYEAIKYFIKGCQLGASKSCYNAGVMYWIGFHVPKRAQTGLVWFGKGCQLGSASSCAGAALAAMSLKPDNPHGGADIARLWFNHARYLDPENGLVIAIGDWFDRGAKTADAPTMLHDGF